jgi:peptidoglycan hydrolase-like protein with peptidoglycan-binding domain
VADPVNKPGGVALSHPEPDIHPFHVAPAVDAKFNVLRAFLIPVGCWRVDDLRFAFGSSFVTPAIKTEMGLLEGLRKAHPGAPLSLFGHADPIGDDTFNKDLSGRRVRAIYALLIRDTKMWEELFTQSTSSDNWGTAAIQTMLKECGEDVEVTGVSDARTNNAIKSFQSKHGLATTGLGPITREAIYKDYMDRICVSSEGVPYVLQKTDFLAKGADPNGKGDYQGCSEFNPFLVFSKAEDAAFAKSPNKTKRNEENSVNRRVMALLFRPDTVIDPGKWPCPTSKEGTAGCKKRFWSDGETRRAPGAVRRTFDATKDTYGCRFYHRLAVSSPCGGGSINENCRVTQIKASIQGTASVRDGTKRFPTKTLAASASTSYDLADNKPVILVQGCLDVDLEAVVSAPGCAVTWTVKPNENDNPACTIVPNGLKAKLKSDQHGSFSVIASTPTSEIVWNVVFVAVVVDLSTASIAAKPEGYVDNGSDGDFVKFTSGVFMPNPGTIAWLGAIGKIELFGGGTSGLLGIDRVEIHSLQNATGDTLTCHYKGGGTVREVAKGSMPVCDSVADDAKPPFGDLNPVQPDQVSKIRSWKDHDSPAGSFSRTHETHTSRLAQRISGANIFRDSVASFSLDARDAIVVHAAADWSANYEGKVATTATGKYTADGAKTKDDSGGFKLIAPGTNGQDAGLAGFETFGPEFRSVDHVFDD